MGASEKLRLMLDFHSTNRDVLYVQLDEDATEPPAFATRWMHNIAKRSYANEDPPRAAGYELAPRPTSDLGTSKNYFYREYGVPSITFETGDNSGSRVAEAKDVVVCGSDDRRAGRLDGD